MFHEIPYLSMSQYTQYQIIIHIAVVNTMI
jgi:hypothetical protein